MSEASDVRKAFEASLWWMDELVESMRVERDRIKAELERSSGVGSFWSG